MLFLFTSAIHTLSAQQRAITDEGDIVILNEDGTWEYQEKGLEQDRIIPTNKKEFKRDKRATFLVKSKINNMGIWIDPLKWKFEKGGDDGDAEYNLSPRDNAMIYARMITERTKIPLENLRNIALINAQTVSPNAKVVRQEYRMVNGLKIMLLQMNGTVEGMKFAYFGYYYSNEKGTIQLVTFTAQDLIEENMKEMENFLNGLAEVRPAGEKTL